MMSTLCHGTLCIVSAVCECGQGEVHLVWSCLQHGESDMNRMGRIGGDGDLSKRGDQVGSRSILLTPQ